MADNDQAIALMGNHEFNAILYNLKDANGNYIREHSKKNQHQHIHTLDQFAGNMQEYHQYISWFKSLPLFYEDEQIRVVHACWDEEHIQYLKHVLPGGLLSDQILLNGYRKGTPFYEALEVTLKGKELQMPAGFTFKDKDGHERSEMRIKWWLNPEKITYRQYSVHHYDSLTDQEIPAELVKHQKPYPKTMKPVFFGHYWLPGSAELSVYENNVCCVDYSVAKEGKLVAYRWNGETCLDHRNMHHV